MHLPDDVAPPVALHPAKDPVHRLGGVAAALVVDAEHPRQLRHLERPGDGGLHVAEGGAGINQWNMEKMQQDQRDWLKAQEDAKRARQAPVGMLNAKLTVNKGAKSNG